MCHATLVSELYDPAPLFLVAVISGWKCRLLFYVDIQRFRHHWHGTLSYENNNMKVYNRFDDELVQHLWMKNEKNDESNGSGSYKYRFLYSRLDSDSSWAVDIVQNLGH